MVLPWLRLRNTDAGVYHVCNFLTIFSQLETRTKESKHVCKFLTIFTPLELTAIGGELWFACGRQQALARCGRAHSSHFFCSTDQGQHVCTIFSSRECLDLCTTNNRNLESHRREKVNAWICARRMTTDHDFASVIPDKNEGSKREKEKKRKMQSCDGRNFMRTYLSN